MAAKKKRWVCPICNVGKLGGQRPAKDNIIRYCLPCSEKTGKLVLRICPADETKKRKKAEALAAKKAKNALKPKKPRTTKRSWMRNARYEYKIFEDQPDEFTINMMRLAERMCASKGWRNDHKIKFLWHSTMMAKGGPNHWYRPNLYSGGIRIARSKKSAQSVGRASYGYGITMTGGLLQGDAIVTLLHEMCHIDQDSSKISVVNGVRRPHDMAFNMQQYEMAKRWWGYDTKPRAAGWSIGEGYAPTRHLSKWLEQQIGARNPKVIKWLAAK